VKAGGSSSEDLNAFLRGIPRNKISAVLLNKV